MNPFGVEHEPVSKVAKSMVAPGVFRPLTGLAKHPHENVAKPIVGAFRGKHTSAFGEYRANTQAHAAWRGFGTPAKRPGSMSMPGNAQADGGRKIWSGADTPRDGKVRILRGPSATQSFSDGHQHPLGGSTAYDGKRGGTIKLFGDYADTATNPAARHVARHELAHSQRTGNPAQWQARKAANPLVSAREEGRAEYMAAGGRTKGSYPGNRKFQREFNRVQRKMARAGTKPIKARAQTLRSRIIDQRGAQ